MPANVLICVPAFGQTMTACTVLTLQTLQMAFAQKGISSGFSTLSFPDIGELRSMYATMFFEGADFKGFTHLLFVDADMGFPPQLCLDQLLLDESLVGTIYPQRKLPVSWAGSGTGEPTAQRKGDFMHVEGVGMGCTLIRRDCFERIAAGAEAALQRRIDATLGEHAAEFAESPLNAHIREAIGAAFPPFFDDRIQMHPAREMLEGAKCRRLVRFFDPMDVPGRGRISEDLSFCIRAREVGIDTWAAIGYRISHVGPYDYGQRYLDHVAVSKPAASPA
jgi:hypothetical protein